MADRHAQLVAEMLREAARLHEQLADTVGDIAVGISTSGGSANVLVALQVAKSRGLTTVAFTRDGGAIGAAADLHVNVPHETAPRIQEVHRTLIHAVCELVEREL